MCVRTVLRRSGTKVSSFGCVCVCVCVSERDMVMLLVLGDDHRLLMCSMILLCYNFLTTPMCV